MSSDRVAWPDRDDVGVVVGCALSEVPMWPVPVVVLDVLGEQRSELAFVPDDRAVE